MGCDIHMYVEYKRRAQRHVDVEECWDSHGGRINPGRHYPLFAELAGVRMGERDTGATPRGLPDDLGFYSRGDSKLFIVGDSDGDPVEGAVFKSTAARWVAEGSSEYIDEGSSVTHPDWHSHSWCTAQELEDAIKRADGEWGVDPGYTALADTLRSFERQGYDARVVFWFDN